MFITRTLVRDLGCSWLSSVITLLGGNLDSSLVSFTFGNGKAVVLFSSLVGEEERWKRGGLPISYLSFCLLLQLAYLLD